MTSIPGGHSNSTFAQISEFILISGAAALIRADGWEYWVSINLWETILTVLSSAVYSEIIPIPEKLDFSEFSGFMELLEFLGIRLVFP